MGGVETDIPECQDDTCPMFKSKIDVAFEQGLHAQFPSGAPWFLGRRAADRLIRSPCYPKKAPGRARQQSTRPLA